MKITSIDPALNVVKRSLRKNVPINREKIILVSLKAATVEIGAYVKAQTIVP